MTAYWVVYINDDLYRELQNVDLYSYIPAEKRMEGVQNNEPIYASMIPGLINMQVEDENIKLNEEIADW